MRPRDKNDFYPTPLGLCRAALSKVDYWRVGSILDPGCGTGVWGEAARERWPSAYLEGIDIVQKLDDYDTYDQLSLCNYLFYSSYRSFDLVVGNPPYKFAEEFVRKSKEILREGGIILMLLRLAFLEGQERGAGFWKEFRPQTVFVCSRRPSFTGNGKTDATAYGVYMWVDGYTGNTTLDWLDWNNDQGT